MIKVKLYELKISNKQHQEFMAKANLKVSIFLGTVNQM